MEKLQRMVEREEERRRREAELFESVTGHGSRRQSIHDSKAREALAAYQERQEAMREEIKELRRQLRDLQEESRQRANFAILGSPGRYRADGVSLASASSPPGPAGDMSATGSPLPRYEQKKQGHHHPHSNLSSPEDSHCPYDASSSSHSGDEAKFRKMRDAQLDAQVSSHPFCEHERMHSLA